jgi:hypothetical protein
MVAAIILVLWLLPGNYTPGLTPRQEQLKQAMNRALVPLGSSTEGLACTSEFKTPIYISCEVNGISNTALASQLEAQGWLPAKPRQSELQRYTAPFMVATLGTDTMSGRWLLTVYHSSD